jgi:hypothetical protein
MWNFAIIKSRIVCVRFLGVLRRRTQDIVPHTPVIVNGFSFLLFEAGGPYGAGQRIVPGEYPPFYGRFFQVSCVFWLRTIPQPVIICCPQTHRFFVPETENSVCAPPFICSLPMWCGFEFFHQKGSRFKAGSSFLTAVPALLNTVCTFFLPVSTNYQRIGLLGGRFNNGILYAGV